MSLHYAYFHVHSVVVPGLAFIGWVAVSDSQVVVVAWS